MSDKMIALVGQIKFHSKLIKNVVVDVTDETSVSRPKDDMNHIAWLAGHLMSSRVMMANCYGVQYEQPFIDIFGKGQGYLPEVTYPSMSEIMNGFDDLSKKLEDAVENASDETINAKAPFPCPTGDTMFDFLIMMNHHEAYTIGQIGILRKYFGLKGMSYS
jgi:hypothetical protein